MAIPLLGVKEFVIHYGGKWGRTIPGKIKTSEYKGGKQESVKYDGDEICFLDLEKDVQKLVGEGVEFQIASLIEGNLCRITEDKHLMDMLGKFKTKNKPLFVFPPPPTAAASITTGTLHHHLNPHLEHQRNLYKSVKVLEDHLDYVIVIQLQFPLKFPLKNNLTQFNLKILNHLPLKNKNQIPLKNNLTQFNLKNLNHLPLKNKNQLPLKKPITPLRKSNRLNVLKNKPLLGPNGEPMIFDIFYDKETAEPEARDELIENVVEEHIGVQGRDELTENVVEEHIGVQARDELTENVVEEHIEPNVHLSQLDPIEPDFCTQNINDFLNELNESNNDHGDAVRVYVDEKFNHGCNIEKARLDQFLARYEYGQTFGPVFGSWIDVGYNSNSQESDDEDYYPIDSEYSDNELGNDIDTMVVDDEVKNLEEELQGTVLGNFMQGTTIVF
ncbi:hypothetical protein IFM89_030030 [Coptis chinensis]|uniref:Uncharacterized protein n=1 Tax=Coptis chinensis TaxID=261450 RepID=A0A835ITU4_9MAGN|nr:hypothetical protein IFM89_030030 [Coptis chinensis]